MRTKSMDSTIRKLAVDYASAKNALIEEIQRDISQPTRTLADLKHAKEYKAVELADYVLQNLEETIRIIEGAIPKQ